MFINGSHIFIKQLRHLQLGKSNRFFFKLNFNFTFAVFGLKNFYLTAHAFSI